MDSHTILQYTKTTEKYCCIYCNRFYKNKTNLDKHLNICQLMQLSISNKNILFDDNNQELPTLTVIYKMFIEMANKVKILEDKLDKINQTIVLEQKKISIIQWLNDTNIPSFKFDKLFENLTFNNITDKIIEMLFNGESFNNVLDKIFSNYFNISDYNYPIIAFQQNPNKIFIYNDLSWEIILKPDLMKFLNKVHMKLCKFFYDWKIMNNRNDDNFIISCDKITIRLMSIIFNENENDFTKAKSILFKNIKQDLKFNSMTIEYDFD
jgi:hypothetical protein